MGNRESLQGFACLADDLSREPTMHIYVLLNQIGFDTFVKDTCGGRNHKQFGRPSLPPGAKFRMMLPGSPLGLTAEWCLPLSICDRLTLPDSLGRVTSTPDNSVVSRIRQRLAREAKMEVFTWALGQLRETRSGRAHGGCGRHHVEAYAVILAEGAVERKIVELGRLKERGVGESQQVSGGRRGLDGSGADAQCGCGWSWRQGCLSRDAHSRRFRARGAGLCLMRS